MNQARQRVTKLSREMVRKYYLDAVSGDDTNRGKIGAPWKSLAKLNQSRIPQNSLIYYKYASTWTTSAPYYDFSSVANGAMPSGWTSGSFTISSGAAVNSPTLGSDC